MHVEIMMGNIVNVYDIEHTICDIIRDRKNQDPKNFQEYGIYIQGIKIKIYGSLGDML